MAIGIGAIVVGLVIAGNIGWFYFRSNTQGGALIRKENAAIATVRRAAAKHQPVPAATCSPFSQTSTAPQGLIEASAIGMRAPVVSGDGNSQLNIAVGHVPASAWPGQPGTTILAAHDVTYFNQIDRLQNGSTLDFVTPCATYAYQVTGHKIVQTGSPIYSNPAQSVLVLDTCYPTDALFLTKQRYLVTARYVDTVNAGQATGPIVTPPVPTVRAPAVLADQGLTLASNNAEMGVLKVTGTPAPSWQQSMAPYDDEAAVLSEYFGAIRSAEQRQPTWWADLTQGVPISAAAPLAGASITGYAVALDTTLTASGSTLTGGTLDAHIRVAGGPAPGEYNLHVAMSDTAGTLLVTQWSMTAI